MKTPCRLAGSLVVLLLSTEPRAQDSGPSQATAPPTLTLPDDTSDGAVWRERVRADRERYNLWLQCVTTRLPECEPSARSAGPMDRLLNDETLQPGDIVSTPTGLKVFRGAIGPVHRLEDFQ